MVISVNWSIHHRKPIIDEKKEIIDYLLLLFCIEIYEKLQLYFIFSIFKPSDLVNVPKEEVDGINCCNEVMKTLKINRFLVISVPSFRSIHLTYW